MTNFYTILTPPESLINKYVPICDNSKVKFPFNPGSMIYTETPLPLALVQFAVMGAFAALASSFASVTVSLGISFLCAAYLGYRIYKVTFATDPLAGAFYKICGGKENYKKLPLFISHAEDNTVKESLQIHEDANKFSHPMYQAYYNGKQALVVKTDNDVLYVFVEKLTQSDFKEVKGTLTGKLKDIVGPSIYAGSDKTVISGCMKAEWANELYLQCGFKKRMR